MSKPAPETRVFDDLAALARVLQSRCEKAEPSALRESARGALEAIERNLFASSVGPVTPLRKSASPPLARPRPAPVARQREIDEAQVLRESMSDDIDADWLLETDDALSFRRVGIGADIVRKLRRGVWATQAQLDLHGLRRDEAHAQLVSFLRDAAQTGRRCVRVIHGKGNGSPGRQSVLKAKVKGWLTQRDDVVAFTQARASDGGSGALLVLLRPGKA